MRYLASVDLQYWRIFGKIILMKTNILLLLGAATAVGCGSLFADELCAKAELAGNEIRLYAKPLAYEVLRDGDVLVSKTKIGMKLDGKCASGDCCKSEAKCAGVAKPVVTVSSEASTIKTAVYKKSYIDGSKVEAFADFGDWGVRLVARKDGVAYRFETKKPVTVDCEMAAITIPSVSARCWFYRNGAGSWGCEESVPEFADAGELPNDEKKLYYLPFVYSVNGKTVAVTETDVYDYPVWDFGKVEKTAEGGVLLKPTMAKYPKKVTHAGGPGYSGNEVYTKGGRWVRVLEREDYLVKAAAARTYPWRTFIIAESPSKLCESDIVYALAESAAAGSDFSWVKPGKVAWDWWNCFDNIGDPVGCTTATYKRFIDFAAANGVEYVIFDEGWSKKLDIWTYSPVVDVEYLIRYANEKNVGIILWMAWAQVYGEEARVAEHFSKLGAKGFKVDFMDRGDARVAQFLEDFARECAKNKMLVDYHGVYRPVGLNRKYPNVLNYEGIHGLEQMKWAKPDKDMPYNDVACFFLRMTAGPMDYTPGAMINHPYGKYTSGEGRRFPGSVGTRCHQMAMMAAYEAPLQMLSDSPTNYEKNMESFSFMAKVPVVWEKTIGLGGCPESYALVARKSHDGAWYVAALNNKDARKIVFTTDFLGAGEWKAEVFRDTADGAVNPSAYIHETKSIKAGAAIDIDVAAGGGFIIKFTK